MLFLVDFMRILDHLMTRGHNMTHIGKAISEAAEKLGWKSQNEIARRAKRDH